MFKNKKMATNEEIRKYFKVFSISLIVLVISLMVVIFIPVNREMKIELQSKFINNSRVAKERVNSYINTLVDSAESISNRLILRQKIMDYKEGTYSFKELKKLTSKIYPVALDEVDNLLDSARIIEGKYLFKFNKVDMSINLANVQKHNKTHVNLKKIKDELLVVVYQPISYKNKIIGHDIVVFDINNFIKTLNQGDINYILISSDENASQNEEVVYNKIYNTKDELLYAYNFKNINGGLICKVKKNIIYKEFRNMQLKTILHIVVTLIISIILVYCIIIKKINVLISLLNEKIDKIKHQQEKIHYRDMKIKNFANISHEFKTPINLVLTALQVLNLYKEKHLSKKNEKNIGKYLDIIKQNNYRLLRLVNNIIDIIAIDTNCFSLNFENVDIVKLIKKTILTVREQVLLNKKILFKSNIKEIIIACDSEQIKRVILNLLSNAVKFTDKEGQIEVSLNLDEKNNNVIICVTDDGVGIKKEKRDMIFKEFRQVDKSFTRISEGTGLGLTIVKKIVQLHQGKVIVEDKNGPGSKFIIKLPNISLDKDDNKDFKYENIIDNIEIEFSDVYDI